MDSLYIILLESAIDCCAGCNVQMLSALTLYRFLNGKAALEGIRTENMYDAWTLAGSNHPGYTFNALDKKQVKRVRLPCLLERETVYYKFTEYRIGICSCLNIMYFEESI